MPQFLSVQLVQISTISLGLMNGGYIYSIHGIYKPTYNISIYIYISIVNGIYKPTFTSLGGAPPNVMMVIMIIALLSSGEGRERATERASDWGIRIFPMKNGEQFGATNRLSQLSQPSNRNG